MLARRPPKLGGSRPPLPEHRTQKQTINTAKCQPQCAGFLPRGGDNLTESPLTVLINTMVNSPGNFDYALSLNRGLGVTMPPSPRNPAEKAVERLGEEIASFEATLSSEEEVGGIIVGAPGNTSFHIIKYYNLNMDILVFEGINEHGRPQRLVQHVTQLSILLTALPKLNEKPRRIGFHLAEAPPSGPTPG